MQSIARKCANSENKYRYLCSRVYGTHSCTFTLSEPLARDTDENSDTVLLEYKTMYSSFQYYEWVIVPYFEV